MKKIKLTKEEMNRLDLETPYVEFDRYATEDEIHHSGRNKGEKYLNNIYQNGKYVGGDLNVVRIGKLIFVVCVLLVFLTILFHFVS